jgi:tRNA(Ile2) C34 agmatinyltransferase TiaS
VMKRLAIGLVIVLAAVVAVDAHHGQAAFDQTTKVTLKGTVTDFHFVNPHSIVEFEVKDAGGRVELWQAEMTSPARLKGWTATSLEAGDVVTVTGYRAKSGALHLWVTALSSSNGTMLKGA